MGCVKVIRYLWRRLAMRVLKPRVVDVDSSLVEELLRGENELERRKHGRILFGDAGSRQ